MTAYTITKKTRTVGFLKYSKEVTRYWIIRDDGVTVASSQDANEAEEILAQFDADEAAYQKMRVASGVPESQFLDENSDG